MVTTQIPRAAPGAALLVIAAAVLFGTTGTAQALGAAQADPTALGAARIVLGGAILGIVALAARRARVPVGAPGWRDWLVVTVGAVGIAAYQPSFFTGTQQNGVAIGTVVALGSAPAFTGLIEWIVRRRHPGGRWVVATLLALAGVTLISGVFTGSTSTITPLGVAGSLAAGLAYAVYAVCSKLLLDRGWSPTGAMGAQFGAAAVLMVPLVVASQPATLTTGPVLATVIWLGVATVAVAYTLYGRGLRSLPAARASTLTLVEPLTAALLGVFLLGESFAVSTAAGMLAILVAVLILSTGPGADASPA